MPFNRHDKALTAEKALPVDGAASASDPIDMGVRTKFASRVEDVEYKLSCPAVPDLVDAKTIVFAVQTSTDAAFTSPTVFNSAFVTLTGAGGSGAAAFSKRFRLASDNLDQYLRVVATSAEGAGDNSGVSFTLQALG